MSVLTVYSFEDQDGEADSYVTQDPTEAHTRGQRYGLRVVANEYEFCDSETVWDFIPDENGER